MWKPRRIPESSRGEELEGVEEHQHSSSEDEEIERELADVTFEELQKARSDGTHAVFRKFNDDKKGGRANKNRPMEVSCKKPVSRYREVVQTSKKVIRDPRFESLCGALDVQGFRKRYNFLFEGDHPESDLHSGKKKKSTDYKGQKLNEELNNPLAQIERQLKSDAKSSDASILANHVRKEREAAKKGKRPFYLKKSDIRKEKLISKYEALKASGKLDAYMEKRRKKNAAKDHRFMPYRRSQNVGEQS